jgi:Leucine-rich repeat (LRR) protein
LSSLKNITTIGLSENHIESIDLTALSTFEDMVNLRLDFLKLKTIDLSPLSSLSKLSVLWLNNNKLTNIDLQPLMGNTALKGGIHSGGVNLADNELNEDSQNQVKQLKEKGIDIHF